MKLLAACTGLLLAVGALYPSATLAESLNQPVADPLDRPAMARSDIGTAMLAGVSGNDDYVVAVGERGWIFVWKLSEEEWTQAEVPVSVLLTNVAVEDGNNVWAVGHSGVILHSEDGGKRWTKQLDGNDLAMLMARSASTPEAEQDAEYLVAEGADKPLFDIAYNRAGANMLAVGAYGMALKLDRSEDEWEAIKYELPNPMGAHLYDIDVFNESVLIAGEMGLILFSEDKGETFESIVSPYEGSFFGGCLLSETSFLVFGLNGNVFHTGDAGENWQNLELGTEASITACAVTRDQVILTGQSGEIFHSADHGRTFRGVEINADAPILDLLPLEEEKVLVVGMRGKQIIEVAK
jgi:photosystem II stability/assembly factor-like uncharacterized protein